MIFVLVQAMRFILKHFFYFSLLDSKRVCNTDGLRDSAGINRTAILVITFYELHRFKQPII